MTSDYANDNSDLRQQGREYKLDLILKRRLAEKRKPSAPPERKKRSEEAAAGQHEADGRDDQHERVLAHPNTITSNAEAIATKTPR